MFLGISPVVTNWSAASDEFSLMLDNNPLAEFAELPEGHEGLLFSNILCGVLRGALEMVRLKVVLLWCYKNYELDNNLLTVWRLLELQNLFSVETIVS